MQCCEGEPVEQRPASACRVSRETKDVYNARWRKVRLTILERDAHICQLRGPNCQIDANEVDHIVPWRSGGALYDPDNLRASCGNCNKRRARRDGVGARKPVRPSREW